MAPPIWLDDHGQRRPTRPCPKCGKESPEHRYRFEHLCMMGWRQPRQVLKIVNWCGHGEDFVPVPEADGYWRLVPVMGELTQVMTGGSPHTIKVNRAPVLTLWAAVVAERLGFTHDEALTLGRAVAGLNAYSKGVSLGLIHPVPEGVREQRKKLQKGKTLTVALLGRAVPVVRTPEGLRALTKGNPDDPAAVTRYLEGKFGDALPDVRGALNQLARSLPPRKLAASAYGLYEKFRPAVPAGTRGWGAKGELDLEKLKALTP